MSAVDGSLLVSPPSSDPLKMTSYVETPGIEERKYQVPSSGLAREQHDDAMEETERVMTEGSRLLIGYQSKQELEMPRCLSASLTKCNLNAAGDPFSFTAPYRFSAKWMERNVCDYFASLWNAKWPYDPRDPDTYWGYVLTMGSSEGNLHAMWTARKYLSLGSFPFLNIDENEAKTGKHLSTTNIPVAFFSREGNHSLIKSADICNLPLFDLIGSQLYPNENPLGGEWVAGVPCTGGDAGPGSIDIDALVKLVDFFSGKGHPIIVVFNYGTTMKCGYDDVQQAGERLVSILKKNNMYECKVPDPFNLGSYVIRKRFWFHVDGALSAAYMPFLEMAYKNGLTDIKPGPVFDFRLDFVMSIVTSGHKWIGSPWPCGVYIMRSGLLPAQKLHAVIGSIDASISLSRNAHSCINLWSVVSMHSYDDQVQLLIQCFRVVHYANEQLKLLEKLLGIDLWITSYDSSLAVIFRRPTAKYVLKYTLPDQPLEINGETRLCTHIYIMPHVTHEKITLLIDDLKSPDAF